MRRCDGLASYSPPTNGTALTIGNFDGVHRGHQRLIATAKTAALRAGAETVVMTFDPHPAAVLAPSRAPTPLTTMSERMRLLESAGVDACIVLRSSPELFARTADEFLRDVVSACRPRVIVEGQDFHFGHRRAGTVDLLRERGDQLGFETVVVAPIVADDLPDTPLISSTEIRTALRAGDIARATALLGRPYEIRGVVGQGDGRGATIGFPTANMADVQHMLPLEGVYAAWTEVARQRIVAAVVNIGPQPTFDQPAVRVEAHLLDFDEDLRRMPLVVMPQQRLRGQVRFSGVEALVAQIREDVAAARSILSTPPLRTQFGAGIRSI